MIEKFGEAIPQIREVGIYFDRYVFGMKVVYRASEAVPEPLTFEHFGSCEGTAPVYKNIKLKKGEYISHVHGRIGCWTDELKVYTNKG